jgi:NRPS condensation-like uncharacterized protein
MIQTEDPYNIMIVLRFERFDSQLAREQLERNFFALEKMRCTVVKFFGWYYFSTHSQTSTTFKRLQNTAVQLVSDVKTESDLNSYVCRESRQMFKMDQLQYKFFLVEEFEQDQSIIILKVNHALCDGHGAASLLLHLQDGFKVGDRPKLPVPTWKIFYMKVLALFSVCKFFGYLGKLPLGDKGINPINNRSKHTGEKTCHKSKFYDLEVVKKVAKQRKVTLNDLLVTCSGEAIKEYMVALDPRDQTSRYQLTMAWSQRTTWTINN